MNSSFYYFLLLYLQLNNLTVKDLLMKFNIKLNDFIKVQFGLVSVIIVLGLLSYIFTYLTGYGTLLGFITLLDVGAEQSIPTYFSVINLLLASILLYLLYRHEKINMQKGTNYWLFLSILFLILSADESATIHEKFGNVYVYLANNNIIPGIFETHGWLAFGIPFVVIFGLGMIPFLMLLPRATLYYFIFAGAVFVIGAVGFEYLGYVMLSTNFAESKEDFIYMIRRIFEEGFEMYGIAIFNCALYREILNKKITLTYTG